MKSIIVSIQPQWCELIASGKKTIEVRKSAPKEVPFKAYIYQTKKRWIYKLLPWLKERQAKVIGEFICDELINVEPDNEYFIFGYAADDLLENMCLTQEDLQYYGRGKKLYGWHISDLKIYDKPKELKEFVKPCDWKFDCCTCKRAVYELTQAEAKLFYGCDREITRPLQSYCYVEEL